MKLSCRVTARHLMLIAILCAASLAANAGEKLLVYTVNYPLQYFAERIAGEHAQVHFPAPADADPALWQPDSESVRQYREADLILLNGAGYAQWLDEADLPHTRLVDTSASFADTYVPDESSPGDPGADHSATGAASNTWLDFSQAALQAEAIQHALVKKQPEYQSRFERNYEELKQELMALDLEMQRLVAQHPGKPLFVSHPVYQYLARRYELQLQSVAWAPDVMPSDQDWEQLVYVQEAFPAAWMLWEGQPITDIRERLQSMGIGVVVFDPCANRPPQGDFMDVMKRNLDNLKPVFAGS